MFHFLLTLHDIYVVITSDFYFKIQVDILVFYTFQQIREYVKMLHLRLLRPEAFISLFGWIWQKRKACIVAIFINELVILNT
jgi:hypothetical protein